MSSILFGDTMVPIIESDHILLLGYSISNSEYYLTRFNHQNKHYSNGDGKGVTVGEAGLGGEEGRAKTKMLIPSPPQLRTLNP